jgi:hypothetical protein
VRVFSTTSGREICWLRPHHGNQYIKWQDYVNNYFKIFFYKKKSLYDYLIIAQGFRERILWDVEDEERYA